MSSPSLDRRWAPIINEVQPGRLESSLEQLRHISAHPDERHPHMRKPVCTCLTPAPRQPTSTTAPTWTPQQRATLTQRDVHGGLFGGFGRKLAKRVKHARCSGQSPAHFHQHHRVLSLVYSYNAEQSKTICDLQSCDVTNPTHLLMSQTLRDLLFRPTYSGILTASVPDFTHDCGGTAMHVALHWGAIHEQ